MEGKHNLRIGPIIVDDDYILVPTYRSSSVSRVGPSGESLWTCELPGYLMTHPSAFGRFLLVQTRDGGRASCGIDIDTGKLLWKDTTNAYGAGTDFGDDARYCVETDCFLSPETTEAWVIARDPRTGERLWHYRKSGTTVDNAPVVDPARNRVYAVFRDGTVVCLDGKDGACLWQAHLPQPPVAATAASYGPYHSWMSLTHGFLAVADESQLFYLLDPLTGRILHRLAVTDDIIRYGKRAGTTPLCALPWIIDDLLVVPAENGVFAYALRCVETASRLDSREATHDR